MDIRDQVALEVFKIALSTPGTRLGVSQEEQEKTVRLISNLSFRSADVFLQERLKTQRDYTITDQGELE